MSYFDSPKQRKIILDRLRVIQAQAADDSLLEELNFSDWGAAFDQLNVQFWKGALPKIPVNFVTTKKKWYGLYRHAGEIRLNGRYGLTSKEYLGVLLHEMCHHWVQVTYGHGVSAANGGKRVIGHGKEWKREMKRVGYTGKITRFTGSERFLPF